MYRYAAGGAMLIVNRQLIVVIIKTLYLNCAEIRQNIKKSRKKLLSNSQDKLKKKMFSPVLFKKLFDRLVEKEHYNTKQKSEIRF